MPLPKYCFPFNGELRLFDIFGSELPPSQPLDDNPGKTTIFRGARCATECVIKRIPLAYADHRAIDFNIELSGAFDNSERLSSGAVHFLRTLTAAYGRPGDGDAVHVYVALEAMQTNLDGAVAASRAFLRMLDSGTPVLQQFDEDAAPVVLWRARRSVARQLVSGVAFLHRTGFGHESRIYHNHLKPSNVLIRNGIVKISEIDAWTHSDGSGGAPVQLEKKHSEGDLQRLPAAGCDAECYRAAASVSNAFSPCKFDPPARATTAVIAADSDDVDALGVAFDATSLRLSRSSNPGSGGDSGGNDPDSSDNTFSIPLTAEEEQYRSRAYNDSFALGCLIYFVLTLGKHPFGSLRPSLSTPEAALGLTPTTVAAADTGADVPGHTGAATVTSVAAAPPPLLYSCVAVRRIAEGAVVDASLVSRTLAGAALAARVATDRLLNALQASAAATAAATAVAASEAAEAEAVMLSPREPRSSHQDPGDAPLQLDLKSQAAAYLPAMNTLISQPLGGFDSDRQAEAEGGRGGTIGQHPQQRHAAATAGAGATAITPVHHQHHTTAVDTVDHEEAADLILSFIDPSLERRVRGGGGPDSVVH